LFEARASFNSIAYVLAGWTTLLSALVFWVSRKYLDGGRIATLSRGTAVPRERDAQGWELLGVYALFFIVISLALLPHAGVVLASLANDWTSRLWPEWTTQNYVRVFTDPSIPAAASIRISLLCATFSMLLDLIIGAALAYALVRGKVWGKAFLDTLAMLPLALPGLILAFGLLLSYRNTPLDPYNGAIPLLILSYAVRRLPYALRGVAAGLAQMSVTLEEASRNLGASAWQTVWNVTRPLVTANLLAAGLLTFAFAVLEVSDSLVLAAQKQDAPIAKAIYALSQATSGGPYMACALGVVGMVLLSTTFLVANRVLGKQLGSLFRA
jgi:iron(III) transport system permease protein